MRSAHGNVNVHVLTTCRPPMQNAIQLPFPISKKSCALCVLQILLRPHFLTPANALGTHEIYIYNFCPAFIPIFNDLISVGPSILNMFSRKFLASHVASCRVLDDVSSGFGLILLRNARVFGAAAVL